MEQVIDRAYLLETMEELINTPSPVGYYDEMNPLLEKYAASLGYELTYDRKKTGYIRVKGEDSSKVICIGAHVDTLGLIIRAIDEDGLIRVRNLGGINYNNVEGETVTIHTRDGRKYTGLAACQYHSVHVYDEARTAIRDESNMIIILDEDVHSREEVKALGIENGDTISLEPHFTVTETGYIKSRFIDDKACVASVFAVLKYMKENNVVPSYDTLFAFPYYEEIGHGGAYVPEEVSSYIALDIGVIGPDHTGSEEQVSICVKDNFSPYDRGLTGDIIQAAKDAQIDHAVDVFYRYGTDATGALRGGNNVHAAAFGMGTYSSHGMERTSVHAVEETSRLLLAVLQLKGENL